MNTSGLNNSGQEMDASEILWNLCHGSSSAITRYSVKPASLMTKLILEGTSFVPGGVIRGQLLMASRIPKEQLSFGISFIGEVRMDIEPEKEIRKKEAADKRPLKKINSKTLKPAKQAPEKKNTPKFGVIVEDDKEQDEESPETSERRLGKKSNKQFDELVSNEKFEEVKIDDKFIGRDKTKFKRCQTSKVPKEEKNQWGSSNSKDSENSQKIEIVSMNFNKMDQEKEFMPISPVGRKPDQEIFQDPNVRLLFKRRQLIFTFPRKMPTNIVMTVPFGIKIPEDFPFSDKINFNEEDQVVGVLRGAQKKFKGFSLEFSLQIFVEDERKKSLLFQYEKVPLSIERKITSIPIPKNIYGVLPFESGDLEEPSFFECIFEKICGSNQCVFRAEMQSANEIHLSLECPNFKSRTISGFLVVLQCEVEIGKKCNLLNLWEEFVLAKNCMPINFKKTIKKRKTTFYPDVQIPFFSIKHSLKVFALTICQSGLSVTKELVKFPISTDWLLIKRETHQRSKFASSMVPGESPFQRSGQDPPLSIERGTIFSGNSNSNSLVVLPFAFCEELTNGQLFQE